MRQDPVGLIEEKLLHYVGQPMECRLCGHPKTHKHGKMPNGHQRYFCSHCTQTFPESFDTLYYDRHVSSEQIQQVLLAHSEGTSLRGISRMSGLAYNTVVSIVRSASAKAQLVHNGQVKQVETEEASADEMWSFVQKNRSNVLQMNYMYSNQA